MYVVFSNAIEAFGLYGLLRFHKNCAVSQTFHSNESAFECEELYRYTIVNGKCSFLFEKKTLYSVHSCQKAILFTLFSFSLLLVNVMN